MNNAMKQSTSLNKGLDSQFPKAHGQQQTPEEWYRGYNG